MREESKKITSEILQFIEMGKDNHASDYDDEFNQLALKLFQFQFQYNQPYKRMCQARKKTPLTVRHWNQIPPMPIQGFKELPLSCEPIEEVEAVFMTSGTTNPELKGKNHHPVLTVWDESMKGPFKHFVLPDHEKMTIFVLSPGEHMNQNSSLARYLSNAVSFFGKEGSQFFFDENGLNMERLAVELKKCKQQKEPVLVMGSTFAYVHFLDYLQDQDLQFHLVEGSRIFDTGGFKGQSREVEMAHMLDLFHEYFHIDRNHYLNMYGMTELSSQIYDQTILSGYLQKRIIHDKTGPAWVRTVVLNTDTLEPVKDGETGVIAHYDLANWNSCLAILTEDMGYRTEHGFLLLGRVKGSEARGCSIAFDQLMQSNIGGVNR